MVKRKMFVLWVVFVCIAAAAGTTWAASARDKELVVDVSKLTEAVEKATAPLFQRTQSTRLKERFATVNQILVKEPVDKTQLVESLKDLQNELDDFTRNWNEVTDPLWEQQEVIAGTADKVRALFVFDVTPLVERQ